MKPVSSVRKSTLVLLVLVFAFGLTACGLDEYADAANSALATYNEAAGTVTTQLFMINDDNSIISDPDWQDTTLSALDEYEAAGKAFASLPEAPDGYKGVESALNDLAFETNSFVDTVRSMIETEDISYMDSVNDYITNINDLINQVDAAISSANE